MALRRGVILNTPAGLLGDLLESSLDSAAEASFAVAGNSMRPLIRAGDKVVLRHPKATQPRLGDVVAIRGMPERGLLLHRIVRVRNGSLLVQGDNSIVDNGEHSVDAVLGVVAGVERSGRLVWFGAGRWGPLVAWAVRNGLVWRVNRLVYGVPRLARTCLKFLGLTSRLREHKGDDGNE